MLKAELTINKEVIVSLTARNIGVVKSKPKSTWRRYKLGCGHILHHDRKKGVLCLLIQMCGHSMMCKKVEIAPEP